MSLPIVENEAGKPVAAVPVTIVGGDGPGPSPGGNAQPLRVQFQGVPVTLADGETGYLLVGQKGQVITQPGHWDEDLDALVPALQGLTDAQAAAILGRADDNTLADSPTAATATLLQLTRAMMSQNAALLNLMANVVQELEAINANTTPSGG